MRRLRTIAGLASVAVAAGVAVAPPDAEAAGRQRTLARGLLSPLSVAVAGDGTAYLTQNFAGILERVRPGGKPRVVYRSKGGNEVGGVSVRDGRVIFTETRSDADGSPVDSWVKQLTRDGRARTIAHVRAFENRRNPDGRITYGARGISPSCAAQWPTEDAGPATWRGLKDSHPYATWQAGRKVYVADAGMNAVLSITGRRIRTVAVLPPAQVPITAELAQQTGVPSCAVGLTYYSESVPTDVELGPDGKLYVPTEGGGLGEMMPLGALYRVNPKGGRPRLVTGGLFAPVGVALNDRGDAFVSELFADRIDKIAKGRHRARRYAAVSMPGALDWAGGLYATTKVLVGTEPPTPPGGTLVRFRR